MVKSKERERAGQISAQIRADQSAHLRSESAAQISAQIRADQNPKNHRSETERGDVTSVAGALQFGSCSKIWIQRERNRNSIEQHQMNE